MTLLPTSDTAPLPIEEVRRLVLMGRIGSTPAASVDHLLQLADLAIANSEVVL